MVLGGQPLATLEQWAADLFSKVPSGQGPRPEFSAAGMPFQVQIAALPTPTSADTSIFAHRSLLTLTRSQVDRWHSYIRDCGFQGPVAILSCFAMKTSG